MRNSWVEQVSIEDKEMKPLGGLYAVEFDDEGEIEIYFVPVRPGAYEYSIENMREDGMLGTFVVKVRGVPVGALASEPAEPIPGAPGPTTAARVTVRRGLHGLSNA